MIRPTGWSKWSHRELGGEYTVLTVALGTGPDQGVEFVYYLGFDGGRHQALVLRLSDWDRFMVPHPTAKNAYETYLAELAGHDDDELDELI